MKYLFTILMLWGSARAQIDTVRLDTLPAYVKVNRCLKWNYYRADWTPLWKNAPYDLSLIPPGGHMSQAVNMKPNYEIVSGYCVVRFYKDGRAKEIVKWLDASRKEIKNRWIEPFLNLR